MKSIMSSDDESMLPPAKIIKVEGKLKELVGGGRGSGYSNYLIFASGTQMEADLERAKKEIEQLKTDHEVSLERKDKEVSHLD